MEAAVAQTYLERVARRIRQKQVRDLAQEFRLREPASGTLQNPLRQAHAVLDPDRLALPGQTSGGMGILHQSSDLSSNTNGISEVPAGPCGDAPASIERAGLHVPAAMGLGLAWVVPFQNSLSFAIGAVIALIWARMHKRTAKKYTIPIASGVIASEALLAAAIAIACTVVGIIWATS
jgi:hypothetical protein